MDTVLLIDKYLEGKQVTESDSFNIVDGAIFRWDFVNVPCPTMEELQTYAAEVETKEAQKQTSAEAKAFLKETDYKVIKYRDQVDMGITPDLSVDEYQYVLVQRQAARQSIV